MKNKNLIILVAVFALLMVGAGLLYPKLAAQIQGDQLAGQQKPEGESDLPPAPDFTAYDAEGSKVRLSDYRGKPVVLNFWSSNCGPCRKEMPHFQAAYDKLGQEVHFLMLNVTDGSWDTKESAARFIADNGFTFPVLYDLDVEAARTYGVYQLPTTLFIDAEGNGVAQATGTLSPEVLQKGIDMIYTPEQEPALAALRLPDLRLAAAPQPAPRPLHGEYCREDDCRLQGHGEYCREEGCRLQGHGEYCREESCRPHRHGEYCREDSRNPGGHCRSGRSRCR